VKRAKNRIYIWIGFFVLLLIAIAITQKIYNDYIFNHSEASLNVADRTWLNYAEDIEEVADDSTLPADYLLALIALECSGFKDVSSRFEPRIYKILLKVKAGEIANFEGILREDIASSDSAALKNLASSWGPFQLMGYKCFHLGIKIKEMRGRKAVFYGAQWIKQTYGKSLEQKKFKDAFHLHNTGKKYPKIGPPKTHSRYYVPRGIKFMKEFDVMLKNL